MKPVRLGERITDDGQNIKVQCLTSRVTLQICYSAAFRFGTNEVGFIITKLFYFANHLCQITHTQGSHGRFFDTTISENTEKIFGLCT